MKCLEISVDTDSEAAEAVTAVFNQYNQGGTVLEEVWMDTAEPPVIRVKTFLPAQNHCTLSRIEEALWHLGQIHPIPAPSIRWLSEADWMEKWKSDYQVQRLGRHIVIRPSWQPYAAAPAEVVIELDPGVAFGTGLHPSTRLCLVALEDGLQPGDHVLDAGTGSGILAIAAAKLGAASVVALDIDPIALQVARDNIARNGAAAIISLQQASLQPLPTPHSPANPAMGAACDQVQTFNASGTWNGAFDLLLMNILAKVIIEAAPLIAACLTASGRFVLSGIIATQEDLVQQALTAAGLTTTERRVQGDWVALIGRKGNR